MLLNSGNAKTNQDSAQDESIQVTRNLLLNPKTVSYEHLDSESRQLVLKTIEFFETKGKEQLKHDDHERVWYADFLEFSHREQLFATFLTPAKFGDGAKRWDTSRNCAINEVLGFYGLSYWYTWQVTILGLGPIWMSNNEEIQHKTARLLGEGEIFAFGLSEKEHGADIYTSDVGLTPQSDSGWLANGSKYYIGNANEAALVSTFGKFNDSGDYVFFAVNSQHENYELVKNVINSQNYVAEYKLNDYPISENDILARGRDAWDMALNTVNVGKFNLGWASIGICSHAFHEAINHAANRHLFDHYVTDFVHVQQLFIDAYARLTAMKLFALRAIDYMRVAGSEDRRYLLFTPMVKMKVTTQGEDVVNALWDVIAAKGFEKDMYFEMAARDIRALPKLEGTVHVNMALIIKFMANYFFKPGSYSETPRQTAPVNDDFLFRQGATKGLGKTRFHDYRTIYKEFNSPNVKIFKKQIRLLKILLVVGKPSKQQIKDFDFLLNLGELFTLVVYGQLILENAKLMKIDPALIDQIFEVMIRDFSKFALQLYTKGSTSFIQQRICTRMVKRPAVNPKQLQHIWETYVYSMKDQYEMNP
ncbi:acyl-CoA dehydrogenase [Desulfosediminicola sp.]|uniref:acyl-CoA dehydrogenase n=1 Tax=Desulfosediminicola sp. TaxID=2886825 RepID=UPI003AF22563